MDPSIPQNNLLINKNLPNKAKTDSRLINTTNFVESKNNNNNKPIISARKTLIITEKPYTREHVGGKGSTLYRIQQAGMKVPEFTTINVNTTENLEQHVLDINSLKPFISDIASFDLSVVNIANIKQYIQNKYSNQPEQRNLYLQGLAKFITSDACYQQISNSQSAKVIRENYQQLITSLPEDSAIIVRSSGIKEDNYGDAQAGKFESIVHGKQDILQTCLQVLASGFQPHVCSYSAPQPMALILQRCIDCSFGGVAMSRKSLTDHRGKIEFVPGQPKGGVSGLAGVTPYCYLVSQQNDEFIAEFIEGNVASQFILKQQDNNNFEEKPVALTENTNANLTEEQLKQIYQYIKQGEDILLCPADIEFAIAKDGTVYIVQLRPLTVLTGGMDFATETPTNPLATGTLVSEGVCSGKLFYVKNQQDAATIPQGAIIVAEHGEDWMLETSFLQKVGGFIFQQGGTNDHVAITLRQQELPCLIIPDDFAKFKTNNEIVTMACCSFNGVASAYVVSGNEFADKLATMQSTVKATYKPRSSEAPIIKTPELYFNKPDIAFKNLNDLNYKLLDYFSADSWLTRCFTEKGMLLLAMAPHRIEIIKEATQEIQQMFTDFEIFIQGYKQYLKLGIKSETDSKELQQKLVEAEKLTFEFNNIKIRVNNNLDNILQQFTNVADQTINKADFNQILQDATNIFADTQQLNMPQNIDEVNSLHDCIFRMHKEFIEVLAAIAINSNLGTITRHRNVNTIVFSNTQEQQELKELYATTFSELLSKKRPKIIILKNAMIATVQLGSHACTIEMLENAESGKQRTLKLKLSDNFINTSHVQGKLKRFWFLVQMLHNIGFDENASAIKASVEEYTGILSIEISHIKTKEIMLNKLSDLIMVLESIDDLDIYANNLLTFGKNINWDFSLLKYKLADLTSIENQQHFNDFILRLGYYFKVNKFIYLNTNKFNQFFEIINTLKSKKNISLIEIEQLFENINKTEQEQLLLFLLEANVTSIINFAKIKYPSWFKDTEMMIKLLSINSTLLEYIDPILSNDIPVVLAAINQDINAVKHIGQKLINNEQFILKFTEVINKLSDEDKFNLEDIPDELLINKDIILAIVGKYPKFYYKLTEVFKLDWFMDKKIMTKLVSLNGLLLKHATILRYNSDVALLAISQNLNAIQYAGENLINNEQFIVKFIECIKTSQNNEEIRLKNIPEVLINRKDILLALVNKNPNYIQSYAIEFRHDTDIALAVLKQNLAFIYRFDDDFLCNNKDISLLLIKEDPSIFSYINKNIQNDKEFILQAIKENFNIYDYISNKFQEDKQILQAYNEASKK